MSVLSRKARQAGLGCGIEASGIVALSDNDSQYRACRHLGQPMLNSLAIATQALVFPIQILSMAAYGAIDLYQTAAALFT